MGQRSHSNRPHAAREHRASTRHALRSIRLWTLLLGTLTLMSTFGNNAEAARHPYFNDGGTLHWETQFASAIAQATRSNRLIFVEVGSKRCTYCKLLCKKVLPHPSVKHRVSQVSIGLAVDPKSMDESLRALFDANLSNRKFYPWCAFLTADGRWIQGWSGKTSLDQFRRHLNAAEQLHLKTSRAHTPNTQRQRFSGSSSAGMPTVGTWGRSRRDFVAPSTIEFG